MGGRPLPTGTVTFLRTDVEGSMRLARALGAAWDELNAIQLATIRRIVDEHGGAAVRTEGDAFFGTFAEALSAVRAAVAIQRALDEHPWPAEAPVRVRIGLHSGEAHLAGDDYGGFDVNRAARVAAVGHGGQIILSDATRALIAGDLPTGVGVRDLGVHALKDVPHPEPLFQLVADDLDEVFPPLRSLEGARSDLPERLTSFIGREHDLERLGELLAASRLVTITGPGGIGKTSVAVELARLHGPRFADGIGWVSLVPVTSADLVVRAIATALGVQEGRERPLAEGIARHLERRELLLVVDNFEHVLDAAPVLGELLRAARSVRAIVTSRAPLHIAGEQEYPLGPLGDAGDADLRLFEERARAVVPGWSVASDEPSVRAICRLVDSLPLGIELAAARVGLMPPSIIRDRLMARLPLPGSGPRDAPERQRTLEGAIGWSVELLDERHRALLAALAVFEGSFDLEQAAVVAGEGWPDPLDALASLVDHSLLVREPPDSRSDAIPGFRFRLLETVRAYALGALEASGSMAAVRDRHADAYLALAERAAPELTSSRMAAWTDRLARDHANLRAAVGWSIEQGATDRAQRLVAGLWRYWQLAGHLDEGRSLTEAVLRLPDEDGLARVGAVAAAGSLAYWQGDAITAQAHYEDELRLSVKHGDLAGEADALFNLASSAFVGDVATSAARLALARERFEQLGDARGVARTDWTHITAMLLEGRTSGDVAYLHELHRRFVAVDDPMYAALAMSVLSMYYMVEGPMAEAARWGARTLRATLANRDVASTVLGLDVAAMLLFELEAPLDAAVVVEAWQSLSAVHGVTAPGRVVDHLIPMQPAERMATLAPEHREQARELGSRLSIDEAGEFAADALERAAARGSAGPAMSPAATGVASPPRATEATMQLEGDVWAMTFGARTVRVRDARGMRYLAALLEAPGREVPAIDLVTLENSPDQRRVARDEDLSTRPDLADPLVDAEARAAYRERLVDLQREIREADEFGDAGRAERLRREFDAITDELTRSTGLGGRSRTTVGPAERARQSVTKALREALLRIARVDANLGAHLRHAVHTGVMCRYEPDPAAPVRWQVRR